MATVSEDHADTASLSSVPDSAIDSDSEGEDMMTAVPAVSSGATATSAKHREAQAESSRMRQAQEQRGRPSSSQPSTDIHTQVMQPAVQQQPIDPDEIPPPPYSEAMRQPASRPDDAVRYAWRQGISHGSLDMSNFNRLLSPTEANSSGQDLGQQDPAHSSDGNFDQGVAPQRPSETSPIREEAASMPDYGTALEHRSNHDLEQGHHQGRTIRVHSVGHRRYQDDSEAGSNSDSSYLIHRRHPRKPSRGKDGYQRRCFNWRNKDFHRGEPRWNDHYKNRRRRRLLWLGIFIVLFVLGMLFWKVVSLKWDSSTSDQPGFNIPGHDKDLKPEIPGQPSRDKFVIPATLIRAPKCPGTKWGEYTTLELSEGSLTIKESLPDIRLTGLIRLVKGDVDQEHEVMTSVAYASNLDNIENTGFHVSAASVEVNTPLIDPEQVYARRDSCVDMDIIAFLRPGTPLQVISLDTAHLAIEIQDGLFSNGTTPGFHVSQSTTFRTTNGNVKVPYLSARSIIIRTRSGRIEGSFSLYDLLSLQSASGAIAAHVDPKPALAEDPTHPAELDLGSASGRLDISVSTQGNIPNRIYKTNVETQSSAISGTFIIGEHSKFKSSSGRLDAELLPYIFSEPPESAGKTLAPPHSIPPTKSEIPSEPDISSEGLLPFPRIPKMPKNPYIPKIPNIPHIPTIPGLPQRPNIPALFPLPGSELAHDPTSLPGEEPIIYLWTGNTASATALIVREPQTAGDLSKTKFIMRATHSSKSGRIDITYPKSWTGTLEAQSTSGRVDVSGSRLERIASQSSGFPWDGIKIGSGGKWERTDEHGKVGRSTAEVESISSAISVRFS